MARGSSGVWIWKLCIGLSVLLVFISVAGWSGCTRQSTTTPTSTPTPVPTPTTPVPPPTLAPSAHTITATAGTGGVVAPSGSLTMSSGTNQTFAISPNVGYHIAGVLVDGASVGAVASYTFTNVTANHTVAASFAINTYIISASAGTGGSITPSGTVTVNYGASQAFTIAPNAGYDISNVLVDGGSVGAVASYTFTGLSANHAIAANFALVPTPKPTSTSVPTRAPVPIPTLPLKAGEGGVQVRITDAPAKGIFGIQTKIKDIEIYRAEDNKWVNILPGPVEFDLIKVSDVEQILGASSVGPGNYSQVKLQVAEAAVNLGIQKIMAGIPNTELRLAGSFRVEAGKTTVLTIDFDAEKSLTLTGEDKTTLNPVAKLIAGEPATEVPALRLNAISKTGIIATIPGYTTIDVSQFQGLVNTAYPGLLPKQIQLFVLLTKDDEAYLVLGMDTNVDRYITAATVEGKRIPPIQGIPNELDWAGRVILSNRVKLLDPIATSPDRVNANPLEYAFKRVVMNTTYVFGSGRLKNSQVLKHIGFALATNRFGSANRNDYLTVVDPYNTETQIRVADIYGTVLYPTNAVRSLLSQAYRLAPEDVSEALGKPSIFFENFKDDEPQPMTIGELVPTPKDPTIKMPKYHGKMVSIEGIAIGGMVKTEDIPQLSNSPIHFTIKAIGVADLTGAMPLIGISSEDTSGEVFGHYRFELSIYRFEGDKAYAFLISKKATPLDPIAQVEKAGFGNRVKSSLNDYVVMKVGPTKLASDLVLEQVDLLLPLDTKNPIIMTRHPNLSNGDYLKTVAFDGYLIDGKFLGVPETILSKYGARVIVVNQASISYEKGTLPLPTRTPTIPAPTPTVSPTPIAIPTQPATPTPVPTPTLPPVPTPKQTIDLRIFNHSDEVDRNKNTVTISGEVVNLGNIRAPPITIIVTLYKVDGTALGGGTGTPVVRTLAPGESSPFSVTIKDLDLSKYQTYIIRATTTQ